MSDVTARVLRILPFVGADALPRAVRAPPPPLVPMQEENPMSDDGSNSDDLFGGLRQTLKGVATVKAAIPGVISAVDGVVNHLVDPATVERVISAGLGSCVQKVVDEARAAASRPPPVPAAPPNHIVCSRHGIHPYESTLVCTVEGCGRVWQVRDVSLPHFAPNVCLCGAQFLPFGSQPTSSKPICSVCAVHIWAKNGRAVRRTTR